VRLRNRSLLSAVAAVAALVVLAAVAARAHGSADTRLTVYAAASLTDVFPRIDPAERYSFAGSNALAAQIRQGAPADVFASANTRLPAQLFARSACSKPVVFTRNALVLVVPASNPARIRGVFDLTRRGVKVVVADQGVPAGDYTLAVLARLKLSTPVLKNVVSRETDVRAVLSKVALAEADAGFVYSTDARTVRGKVKVIGLPARGEPDVRYGMCIVTTSRRHRADAQAFVERVLSTAGQAKLTAAGFLPRVDPLAKTK
jgi:molybdate transport system substrate-binding protein